MFFNRVACFYKLLQASSNQELLFLNSILLFYLNVKIQKLWTLLFDTGVPIFNMAHKHQVRAQTAGSEQRDRVTLRFFTHKLSSVSCIATNKGIHGFQ